MTLKSLWVGALLCTVFASVEARSVEIETLTDEDGESCERYQYSFRDVAEQRRSPEVRQALLESRGKTIREIRFVSRSIFDESDPAENNWLYRGFNRFHINTHEAVIAGQLLLEPGDVMRQRLVEESERILRSRNYLTSAFILPEAVCGDTIDLLVVTRDSWVTEPEITFKHEGGETETGFGIKDGNFLGTGDAISLRYDQDVERNSLGYEYKTDHFMKTRLATRLYYAEKSDGQDKAFSLERPFFSLETPWAAGGFIEDVSEIRVIREGGDIINEFRHRTRDNEVYFGLAARADERFTRRWRVGLTREEDVFSATEETVLGYPEERKGNYAWVGLEVIENQFATYRNLNQIQRTEDVALGVNYQMRVGYGGTGLDNDRELYRYQASYSNVIGVGKHHILQLHGDLDGRHYSAPSSIDSGVAGVEVTYNWFRDDKNRWFFRVRYDHGANLEQFEQITLGGDNGLRGYPVDYQRGERRYVFNLERRYFSDWHIFNVVRMGAVAFFDAGRVWGGQIDGEENGHLSNVGIGLRFSSSKTKVGNVLHVDLATPLAERGGLDSFQLLVKASSTF